LEQSFDKAPHDRGCLELTSDEFVCAMGEPSGSFAEQHTEGAQEAADLVLQLDPGVDQDVSRGEAIPVILNSQDEIDTCLTAPTEEALQLQRPLPDHALTIVARGERKDEVGEIAA